MTMESNFICPCCEYSGVYRKEIAEEIFEVVLSFYQLQRSEVMTMHKWRKEHRHARVVTAYFIRQMTGHPFKTISRDFFGFHECTLTTRYFRDLQRQLRINRKVRREVADIQRQIRERFNQKKNLEKHLDIVEEILL